MGNRSQRRVLQQEQNKGWGQGGIMKPTKKTQKHKPLESQPTIEDVLRNQINLYQYCNDLSNKLRDMEIAMQHFDFQSQMMKRDNFEVKSLLSNLGNHLKTMHEREMTDRPATEHIEGPETENKVQPMMKKALPLHDDVMMNCEVCGCNHHLNAKLCPKCGFDRAKKG
jgi:hypothetical protein